MTEVIYKNRSSENRFKPMILQPKADTAVLKNTINLTSERAQTNMSVKNSMAEELRQMGLSETAVAKHLNIK